MLLTISMMMSICFLIIMTGTLDAFRLIEVCHHLEGALSLSAEEVRECEGGNREALKMFSKLNKDDEALWCDPLGEGHLVWANEKSIVTQCVRARLDKN